jgi:uncharacterized phiE125 gp8 family phage protein
MEYKFQAFYVKTQPSAEPVTAAEIRDELRLDDTSQDTMIGRHITAARMAVETKLHRTLINTVLVATFDGFPSDPNMFALPRGPYVSVDEITYIDEDGDSQTLAASGYRADLKSFPCRIEPAFGETWPTTRNVISAVSVEYTAGYGHQAGDQGAGRRPVRAPRGPA